MKQPKALKIVLKKVKSSAIQAVGYHEPSKTLRIKFTGGAVHEYPNVDADTHAALMGADSIGKHFNQNLRGLGSTKIS